MTVLLAFGYWALYSSGITLAQHGSVPPIPAVWGSNVLMLGLGSFLIARLKL
jgi:lipopolysaccharide export system permease protein